MIALIIVAAIVNLMLVIGLACFGIYRWYLAEVRKAVDGYSRPILSALMPKPEPEGRIRFTKEMQGGLIDADIPVRARDLPDVMTGVLAVGAGLLVGRVIAARLKELS